MKERFTSGMVRLLTVLCLCGPLLAPAGAAVAAPEAPAGPVLSPMGESTIGDLVWHDSNVDGLQNDDSPPVWSGINGVVVNLYLSDGDADFEPGAGDVLTDTLTTADNLDPPLNSGWYDFPATGNTQYWVEIAPSNFLSGGPLENYVYTGDLDGQPYNGPQPRRVDLVGTIVDHNDADFGYALAGIEIVKVADGTPDGDTKFIHASDTVTYTYRYTNTGEAHLDSVIITDDLGTVTPVDDVQICTHTGLLAPGTAGQCEWSDSVDSNRTNIATVVGNPTDSLGTDLPGNNATDSDDAVVVIEAPCLEVTKNLDDPIGGVTVVSETITYTIWITNCGTTTVTHVPLYDYFCPACMEFTSWSIPPTNVDDLLGTVYWEDVLSPTVGGPDILLPTEGFSVTVDFHAVISDTMYWKEKWHDYALSGMPDLDQKQDAWGADPGSGWRWTYCGPVAAANSIWWFDSKFEDPNSPPPPTENDSYDLVTAYGAWDDHDPANVQPLVDSLAWYVDTDGIRTGSPISGTNVHDLAAGIAQYITDTVGPGQYTVIDVPAPEFAFIEDEVRRSEDVILLLGFWQDSGVYERVGGHYVTVAGVDSENFLLALSDPYRNNAAGPNLPYWMGGLGRVRPNPHDHPPFPLQPPGEDTVHNDSWFTSHDVYVAELSPTPGGPWGLQDYAVTLTCDEISNFVGQNVGDIPNTLDHCLLGVPVFTEIEYVVAVSPAFEETIPCQPVNNVVVISGAEDEHGFEIPEVQDNETITITQASIAIDKVPDNQQVVSGGTANWTIYVTNTGDVDLTNVVVTDALAPSCNNTIGALAVGASTSYACSRSPVTADFTNVAVVTGDPPVGPSVTDNDDADVDVINPDIAIDKVPDNQQVVSGGTANWTIYVTNTGDVDLTNVVVTDALAPSCNNTIGALAVGASTSYACSRSPVTADFTNVAVVTGDPPVGPSVTDNDDADVDVINPDIAIDKVPDNQQVVSGGTANWTIYVTNTGDVDLSNVVVTDALAPSCNNTIGALAVGASTSYACSRSPVTADFTNVAVVTGDPPVGPSVTDNDDADVDVINPGIAIDKVPDNQQVVSGGTANWTIYVTNTGDVDLTNVVVTDALAPSCNNTIGALAVGASTSYACSRSPVTADFTNVADVTGDPPVGPPVTDSDDADVDVLGPDIAIDKVPDNQQVVSGGTANWTIYVTNTGDVDLTNVVVTDALAPSCNNTIGALAVGASTSYACSRSPVTADFTNVAVVTGDPPVGPSVTDNDDADVDVINPDIAIDKVPDNQQVVSGGTANWTIYVTNTGDVDLSNVVVTDALAPSCNNTIGALAVGASTSYACSRSPVTADFTNVAVVTGDPPVGPSVTDNDDADVDVINPDIAIDKVPDNQQVVSGGTANWTIYVTNTGDVDLSNVVVTDALAPSCNNTIGALAVGASTSYACSRSPVTADFTNVAVATGDPPVGPPVTDNDDAYVDVINPGIAIAKTPDFQQVVSGGTANFTIYVTNTGDVALSNVTVSDPLAPNCVASLGTLAAGVSTNYSCSVGPVFSDFTNVATVTGNPPVGPPVTDDDDADVEVIGPDIAIDKAPDYQQVLSGGTANWTIYVTNTGNVPLVNVMVTDALAPGCNITIGTLGVGVSASYACSRSGVTADFTNVAVVTGDPPMGPPVTDQDDADVDVISGYPELEVTKTLIVPAGGIAVVSDTVRFQIRVHNIGTTNIITLPLSDVFDDACLSYVTASPLPNNIVGNLLIWYDLGPLAVGGSVYVTVDFHADAACDPAVNTACVTNAVDENLQPVPGDCDDDDVIIIEDATPTPTPTPTHTPTPTPTRTPTPTLTPTPTPTPTGQPFCCIHGHKVDDLHIGLPGWVIHARPQGQQSPIYTEVTDGSGYFIFTGLEQCGVWTLWEEPQSGWTPVTPPEFDVQTMPGECVYVRFKNRQATPTPTPPRTPTPTPTVTPTLPCPPDPYEVDDTCGQASPISVNGWVQHHNFHEPNDDDWVRFQAYAGVDYTITTSNLAGPIDTRLWLYDSDCTTLLAFNDDYVVGNYASQIVYTATHNGMLHVKVDEYFGRGECATYDLSVVEGPREHRVYLPILFKPQPWWPTPTPTRQPDVMRHPKVVDVNPRTHVVYVTSRGNNSLYAIDGQTMAQLGQVHVGAEPFGVAVNFNTNKVYVACFASGEVYVVDGTSLAVLDHFPVGSEPTYVAVNPDTNRIYVALHGLNGVAVINGATDTVIDHVGSGGVGTFGIAVNRHLNRIYVSNRDVSSIGTIDGATNSVISSQTVHLQPSGSVPFELDYNESTHKLYVVYGPHNIPNKVWVYMATAGGLAPLKSIDVGHGGSDGGGGIVANPSRNHIFVTNSAENSISVIDGVTDTVAWTIYHPAVYLQNPFGIAVDHTLNMVYVVNRTGNNVVRFPGF